MATFSLPAVQLPFVLGGSDQLTVDVGTTSLLQPLTPDVGAIFTVGTDGAGQQPLTIGLPGWGSVAIKSGTTFDITAVWPTSAALIAKHGLAPYFASNPRDLVLVLDLGGSADASFTGRFTYAPLTADVSLNADADFAFTFAKGCARDQPLNVLLSALLRDVKLPAALDAPLSAGEAITFQYRRLPEHRGKRRRRVRAAGDAVDRDRSAAACGSVLAEHRRNPRPLCKGGRVFRHRDARCR